MFNIPRETLDEWAGDNWPKATKADIDLIENYLGSALPPPYIEFISTYGFVEFPDELDGFTYTLDYGGQKVQRASGIAYMRRSDLVIKAHSIATAAAQDPDDDVPKFPAHFLPIGQDPGQSEVLLELGEHGGRVWFWEFDEHQWGQPGNDALGFVANDLYEFINGLQPYDDLT